jgi:periplasmic protein CpxP/Spy
MKRILLICCLFIGSIAAGHAQTNHAPSADPVEKAKGLQKQLKLSNKQTEKIGAIYKESSEKFDKIRVKENGNTNKMMADVGPLRAITIKKIKAVLTPSQTVKYDKLIKQSKDSGLNGGWSDGWSSTGSSN